MLLAKRQGQAQPYELADLHGKRLAISAELDDRRLSENLIKDLTGDELLSARQIYKEAINYRPTHTLMMYGNDKPVISGTDEGIWRRLLEIPFTVEIAEHERDLKLKEKLLAELQGILAWAVQGAIEWFRNGLQVPHEVRAASAAYRQEMDILGRYLDERCVTGPRYEVKASLLYADYVRWCDENGEYARKQNWFGKELSRRGFGERKSNGVIRTGIGLLADYPGASPPRPDPAPAPPEPPTPAPAPPTAEERRAVEGARAAGNIAFVEDAQDGRFYLCNATDLTIVMPRSFDDIEQAQRWAALL